jgi:excisionase family DNA binding protein
MNRSAPEHAGDLPAHLHDIVYVQELLGCSSAKIRQLIARGELSAYRTGHRSYRFSDRQISDYLAAVAV